MLFNSFEFIFVFLPVTVFIFFFIGRRDASKHYKSAIVWLVITSLFFYAWWNPANLWLLGFSIVFNYLAGYLLRKKQGSTLNAKWLLIGAIAVNLGLIGYFKYASFFAASINALVGSNFQFGSTDLPLAISFFTFVQITYLVDAYQDETRDDNFSNYTLFVTFFPHLIAGPIVHHKDLMPQFADRSIYRFNSKYVAIGLTIFFMGLFKKVVFADPISAYVSPVFDAAAQGIPVTFFEAWVGALSYTLQLYFDFSGYSDMAIGAAYLFGIKLPLNFDSPYKASSIIDFWRRWHITLSNFLRDYLYIPLGGSRKGPFRRHLNLMITMLLGGLWHGAGWTFVLWGGLHGLYLVINHQWRSLRRQFGHDPNQSHWLYRGMSWLVTFVAVVVSWVLFRAASMQAATVLLGTMAGTNGISLPRGLESKLSVLGNVGFQFNGLSSSLNLSIAPVIQGITLLLLIAWFTPNTQQWMGKYNPIEIEPSTTPHWLDRVWQKWQWRPNMAWAIVGTLMTITALLNLTRVSEFLYFQF
ncbi:MBOAT family protein [Oculatella sp. LEGE 06141]|uniref:MBOAT family O-acyltransferase n=1 Tax=Oculatella sp. LEGE 06141 TaxID=1828648 RepID=UPI00187E06E3|nr:MBOAT family protein [Oculatella sp. LEGE 06141]MBE9180810.1 MBOAT family protein [Oculatella sp. LEGE 06141]